VKRFILVLILCCFPLLLTAAEDRFNDIGGKIQCACGCAQMLLKCNHVGCQSSEGMIRQLRAKVSEYSNDEDVLNWFRRNYGMTVVVSPATHGFELWIWVVPPVLGAAFLILVIMLIRRWRMRMAPIHAAELAFDPHLQQLQERARKETEL
jgi:cytochrome c-type biogenesis protein CcmH